MPRKASTSKRVAVSRRIPRVAGAMDDAWSKGVLRAAGAFADFPELKELRKGYGNDTPRASLK